MELVRHFDVGPDDAFLRRSQAKQQLTSVLRYQRDGDVFKAWNVVSVPGFRYTNWVRYTKGDPSSEDATRAGATSEGERRHTELSTKRPIKVRNIAEATLKGDVEHLFRAAR